MVERGYVNLTIPQTKPRSSGEVLGCTSPQINLKANNNEDVNLINTPEPIVIFICDGRFHMESAMIANPSLIFYQYNPFLKIITLEKYEVELMKSVRQQMISNCKSAKNVGIIFVILGRQGNPDILDNITKILKKNDITYNVILLSEIMDYKLMQYEECECFVQIACPRISIDWEAISRNLSLHRMKPLWYGEMYSGKISTPWIFTHMREASGVIIITRDLRIIRNKINYLIDLLCNLLISRNYIFFYKALKIIYSIVKITLKCAVQILIVIKHVLTLKVIIC